MDTAVLLATLIRSCVAHGKSFSLEYDNGRYVAGEDALDAQGKPISLEQIPPEKVKQRPGGFRVQVGGHFLVDRKTESELLYATLDKAVEAGWYLIGGMQEKV